MPYKVGKSSKCPQSKPWACMKESDGSVVGCHTSKADAEAQMRALYANEKKSKNLGKLHEVLKKDDLSHITISFPDSVDLAKAAKQASESGQEYIEIEGYASTTQKNDRGFRIAPSTWKKDSVFTRLKANPMVLFNHKTDFPIGQVTGWEAKDDGLFVQLRLRYNAILPTQEKLGDVVGDKTLRGLSLGISIEDFEVVELPDGAGHDITVTDAVIGEITLCSVPSDAGAIADLCEKLSTAYNLASIADESEKGGNMWKLLAKKFGMDPEKVTEEEVMTEYNRREQLGASAVIGLGLDPNKVTAEQLTAAIAARDPEKLKLLQKNNAELAARVLVDKAITLKKIAQNDKDTTEWALAYAEKDSVGFEKWLALAKDIDVPETRHIAPGSGAQNGGEPGGNGKTFITKEDREVCLKFGHFKTPEEMDKMAETTPNEALAWVLGQNFPATEHDRAVVENRRALDRACGITR